MKTDEIIIANLKCGGCASTITSRLMELAGVSKVVVDNDNDKVSIEHDDQSDKAAFVKLLSSLGYPEATAENGLLLQLKSYASCMVGRVNNMVK